MVRRLGEAWLRMNERAIYAERYFLLRLDLQTQEYVLSETSKADQTKRPAMARSDPATPFLGQAYARWKLPPRS